MAPPIIIEDQKLIIKKYFKTKHNLNISKLTKINSFLNTSIQGIIAIKIWRKRLEKKNKKEILIYLDEIASNFNQVIVLGVLGFKIPATILIRRSYENMDAFLFYKDHPVEFYLKESELPRKNLKIDEIKAYFEKFPFQINEYQPFNINKSQQLIIHLLKHKGDEYSILSNYVHATNHKYFELNNYLGTVVPNDESLELLDARIVEFNTLFNTVFILFFFKEYQTFLESEKKIIRTSIMSGQKRYKKQIQDIFGEN